MATDPSEVTIWSAGGEVQIPGPRGPRGPEGPPPNLTKGSVTSGVDADFTIRGTSPDYILDLVLPEGPKGNSGTAGAPGLFSSVQVTQLPEGSQPTASISGPSNAQVLELGIPLALQGPPGDDGPPGDEGPEGPPGKLSDIKAIGTGVRLIVGVGGDDENEIEHLTILDTRTIKAQALPNEGLKLRYAPSYVRVKRTNDASPASPYVVNWHEASGSASDSFNSGDAANITVPAGVEQVEVIAQVRVDKDSGETNQEVRVSLLRNEGHLGTRVIAVGESDIVTLVSGVVTVSPGDKLSIQVDAASMESVLAQATWMEVKFYS